MADSNKKVQPYTSFNAGEYSPELAGRVDLESFGSSSRFMSNMMSQISGGVKKFYGTTHVAEVTPEEGQSGVKFVPFINKYEPMVLVFWGIDRTSETPAESINIGLIYGDNYKPLDLKFPSSIDINEMRWKQINDTIIFAHNSVQPLSISFYGRDDNGDYLFMATDIKFDEVPYFPIGATEDYRGTLESTGVSGEITLSLPDGTSNIRSRFPSPLNTQGTYTRTQEEVMPAHLSDQYTVNNSTIQLIRARNGVETILCSGTCNSYYVQHYQQGIHYYNSVTDTISREKVLQVIRGTYPLSYLQDNQIVLIGVSDHQDNDEYYMRLNRGAITFDNSVVFPAETTVSVPYVPVHITTGELNAEQWLGRKIKFYFDDDTVISPWWQGRSGISVGDYVYSNGHWYKATSAGTCGNIQPSHTFGTRSDGGVNWLYVHSGSGTATITGVPTSTTITAIVEKGELPSNKIVDGKYQFSNYAWSIWGYHGIHPSEVYMAGNRLGFVCNTDGYGAWNAMSVTDDYYNFSTEEYGEQLDTSAIVHLIANNESGVINWVLSRKNVYMGSFSGEYNIRGATNGVFTPTATVVENISNMGGKAVVPLKYKELNMFVGITGKELYTIGYDYTIDDYTPHSLGYMTEHLMERGVRRIEALNNLDRNIYLLHDTNQLSLFNYAREQKIMGFSELDFGAPVLDYVTTSANDIVAGYVATIRNDKCATITQTRGSTLSGLSVDDEKFSKMVGTDGSYGFEYGVGDWYHDGNVVDLDDYGISFTGTPHNTDEITVEFIARKITFERLATIKPTYMWDVIYVGDGETAQPITGVTHHAGKEVWVKYGDGQFVRTTLDENGDSIGVPAATMYEIGLPMMAELHTQPAFGMKVEGHQQQSLYACLRLNETGSFEYGASVDFDQYFPYKYWNNEQEWDAAHRLYTGDAIVNIPLGYAENANQGEGPYPNTTGVGVNLRSDTPEPFNLLSIQEIYK